MVNINTMINKKLKLTDQSGVASILITFIMIIVISLIVLGFAQISRREVREALDTQLSTQAYYAAEVGVNNALYAIAKGYLVTSPTGKTTCMTPTDTFFPENINIDGSGDPSVINPTPMYDDQIPCLLINPIPGTLSYENVGLDQSTVIPIEPVDPANPANPKNPGPLFISWQQVQGINPPAYSGCGPNGSLPPAASWSANCYAGVLQLDIVPQTAFTNIPGSCAGSVRCSLDAAAITVYLRPVTSPNGTTTAALGSLTEGEVIPVTCATGATAPLLGCNFSISGLGPSPWIYYLRLRSFYEPNAVNISATTNAVFSGAQVIIDSTGKAHNDVLRRISVRAPLNFSSSTPGYAIQSTLSICKLFSISSPSSLPVWGTAPAGTDATACTFPT